METGAAHKTLSIGEMLNWYRVERVLGRGGFGVIYLATDTNLDHPVAIKEYIPTGLARRAGDTAVEPLTQQHGDLYRWGLERFIREARNLVRFKHPNIVRVMSVFQQNNTAYMVMEFEEGENLRVYLEAEGRRREARLKSLIAPICEGLTEVHRHGFIHRDIKPANILIRPDGSPVVLDFGSARDVSSTGGEALTALVTVGYAPLEQYDDNDDEQQGPWTDIYALGGVLYYAIGGSDPVDSARRGSALLNGGRDPQIPATVLGRGRYSEDFLEAIDWALSFRIADRPQTLADWLPALLGKTSVRVARQSAPSIDTLMDMTGGESVAGKPTVVAPAVPANPPRRRVNDRTVYTGMENSAESPRPVKLVRRRRSWRRSLRTLLPLLSMVAVGLVGLALVIIGPGNDAPVVAPDVAVTTLPDRVAAGGPEASAQPLVESTEMTALAVERSRQLERLADIERREQALEEQQAAADAASESRALAEEQAAAAARQAARDAEQAAKEAERKAAAASERREELLAQARARQAIAANEQFTAALDNADSALAERRVDDAVAFLNQARASGLTGSRLEILEARLERVIAEMTRPVTDAEFDRVVRRFDGLKRAIEAKDFAVIDAITQESEQNALFGQLMNNFDRLNMAITGIRVRNADKSVTANLRITDMIRQNGDRAVPSAAFRDREITSRLVDGQWSRIQW